ncbi:4'-phosphopantetheinyl transferase [Cohnella kolymensis]|uniref:Holo-[acyl-carrier-protein] synthase n=1 Tax=Cohnella kolymensis TaxID=1590652 RepID=A0ABR5A7K5_9BACL|nr:holo-ACP synthase [Cohnella kolymensis]KIL36788.1 4'-phosphopantetheinyl transferase [Cohnella kolymensis]KIL37429.1 4'-phosphopantetheinyl transferase [Cohnella kolymensis]
MIVGVGLDVVELERIAGIMAGPSKERFAARILTVQERSRWSALPARRALEFIAGRFAAKEAAAKALGCGIGRVVGFQDIELLSDRQGKPHCTLSEAAVSRLQWTDKTFHIHVAISHERSLAAATAIIES